MYLPETPDTQRFLLFEIAALKRQLGNDSSQTRRTLILAITASLFLHGLVLFWPMRTPPVAERPAARLEARLAAPVSKSRNDAATVRAAPSAKAPSPKPQSPRRVLAIAKPKGPAASAPSPKSTVAQQDEMSSFLRELEVEAQARPRPDLAQRSLSMARAFSRQQAKQEREGSEVLELLPNAPPVHPFSLEMYLDALVKKLNRSAGFARNDPRSHGVQKASVQVRLNPDGSLQSFRILNAGDQQAQIAFIKSVVDQAVPFAPFPSDLRRSASALNMVICIEPRSGEVGGFGFSRLPAGRGC